MATQNEPKNKISIPKIYLVEYEINGVKYSSEYMLYPNDRIENMLPPDVRIISIKEKMAEGRLDNALLKH